MASRPHRMSWLVSVLAGASLMLISVGCVEEPPPGPDLIAEMTAGTSALDGTGFNIVSSGQDAELVSGAQGGFHVWINFRVQKTAGRLYIRREARRVVDDELILRGLPALVEVPEDAMSGWWESPAAAPAFMCPSPLGLKVFDQEISFQVTLETESGELVAEDEVILTPRCPDNEHNQFCQDICSG